MIIEVRGLEAEGRHGADEDERARAQRFLFDVELDVEEPREDTLAATADYRVVRDAVREICGRESYVLLETLAAAVAEELTRKLSARHVRVRVRKPGITWAEWTAASVERS